MGVSVAGQVQAVQHRCEEGVGFVPRIHPRKPLSLRETMQILTGENALNIRVLNLRNHTSMANWMIFVTGSSLSHQKRIGDTIVHYVSAFCYVHH